ncbi:hypothetical protein DPF_0853 [Desulfoplanes formicivorans]|uniref:Uncharacterized protein n=1 Tax=Desulfoplanes formicivorans TaxID=1592317 RepID=A0A194AG20_9BACT|nr:hypothetical protein DPF_0853 [Desulfoplanes formicivorans]
MGVKKSDNFFDTYRRHNGPRMSERWPRGQVCLNKRMVCAGRYCRREASDNNASRTGGVYAIRVA